MIVTTTDIVQGQEVQSYLGIVTAEVGNYSGVYEIMGVSG